MCLAVLNTSKYNQNVQVLLNGFKWVKISLNIIKLIKILHIGSTRLGVA